MPLLEIEDLSVGFHTERGLARVVDDLSFTIDAGRIVGLVGESGCGKSVTARAIMRLLPCPPAQIEGKRLALDGRKPAGARTSAPCATCAATASA